MFRNQALKEGSDLCTKTNKCTCIKYVVPIKTNMHHIFYTCAFVGFIA